MTTTKASCIDHYRIICVFCREIVRQCACHIGDDKPVFRNGCCRTCGMQIDPATQEIERLRVRQAELLATIAQLSQGLPFPDEVDSLVNQLANARGDTLKTAVKP